MAEFFWEENPFHGSQKTLVLGKEVAISTVRSVEPESTTMSSLAQRTLARVRPRLASSSRVMMATESVICMPGIPFRDGGSKSVSMWFEVSRL